VNGSLQNVPKDVQFMIAAQRIKDYVDELVRQFAPQRVVMFGSYASGKPRPDSDVDLLVVMRHSGAAAEQAARIRRSIRAGFPVDIIVRSPAVIRRRKAMGDGFIREILENGKVLHESHGA
jgi:predicted nucleotidyltransferase